MCLIIHGPIEFSIVPDGTNNFDVPPTPAMNRWAIIGLSLRDFENLETRHEWRAKKLNTSFG